MAAEDCSDGKKERPSHRGRDRMGLKLKAIGKMGREETITKNDRVVEGWQGNE